MMLSSGLDNSAYVRSSIINRCVGTIVSVIKRDVYN